MLTLCLVGICAQQALAQTAQLGTPDFFSAQPFGGTSFSPPVAVRSGPPPMPPPPGVRAAAPVLPTSQPIIVGQAPAIANQPPVLGQPPVVVGPPVAQGFGANAIASPPGIVAPAPYGAPAAGGVGAISPGGLGVQDYVRFVQAIRFQHTWLPGDGDKGDEFDIHDSEAAVTFAYPDFFFTQDPLLITPGFILHTWDPPPHPMVAGGIPSRAYSAYLDLFWAPRLTQQLSAELDFRIGVYSDFEEVSSDAIRPQGYGAGIYQVSPTFAIKLGGTYINRVDVKFLPVAGIIYTPNQYTRWDITFPNPKLSNYLTTWGTTDIWWYVAGEYGGGSWEIDNAGNQKMDINDIRAIVGLEWLGGFSNRAFIEAGYVFERELVFEAPIGARTLDETWMIRGGITF